jgi:hypothetical protein
MCMSGCTRHRPTTFARAPHRHMTPHRCWQEEAEANGGMFECGCCCCETAFEEMISCDEGHMFCANCLKRLVEVRPVVYSVRSLVYSAPFVSTLGSMCGLMRGTGLCQLPQTPSQSTVTCVLCTVVAVRLETCAEWQGCDRAARLQPASTRVLRCT